MKKIVSVLLTLAMILCAFGAMADTLAPGHTLDMSSYGAEDTTVTVRFEPATDISSTEITYSVYLDDIYPAAAVKALKAGDTVISFGDEYTVATVEEADGEIIINGGFSEVDDGLDFRYADGDPDSMVSVGYDDMLSSTNVSSYTLKLADEVTIHYYLTDDGEPTGEMADVTLAAAEVKDFFAARSDYESPDYLSVYGIVLLRSANNEVLEITVIWTPYC